MQELTLEWIEAAQRQTQTIKAQQPSKNPGTVRIGRDRTRCDIVLSDPMVSGLHIEIFFNPQQNCFYLRNLRESNPPIVDGYTLRAGEVVLNSDSTLLLGQTRLKVTKISQSVSNIPPTILMSPDPQTSAPPEQEYGLKCSKCDRISLYEWQESTCPKCGSNLAQAWSVLIPPTEKIRLEKTKKPE